jgi:arylsulfatase A
MKTFSQALAVFGLAISAVCSADRPNIVMIMADDLGYECIGANGSEMYSTPHLDELAVGGMRFLHAHSQPICTPSRVQIMTGKYNNRNYVKFGILDPKETTFGNALQDAGYQTYIAGKWQLEGGFEGPVKFGFEKYCLWQLTRRPSRYPNPGFEINGEEKDFKDGKFGPDVVTDHINGFLESRDESKPFFVYYPMILPHWPFVPTPDGEDWDPTLWRDKESEPGGFRTQKYWADDVAYTDKMVGKVVSKLDELGLRENTLVIFTGDNGTATQIKSTFQGKPYPGGKGSPKDSGTRVPFIASWPGTIEAGSESKELVDFSDLFPTFVEMAGLESSKIEAYDLDGVSLLPIFTGEGKRDKPYIYCWYHRDGERDKASEHVRDQRYKLYSDGRFYDIQSDFEEKNNLAKLAEGKAADRLEKLQAAMKKHRAATLAADPIQAKRREGMTRKALEKKKKEAPEKKKKAE